MSFSANTSLPHNHDPDLEQLVDRADLDELVRRIDELCSTRDWETLYHLRSLTRAAITTGRQVWPATTLAEYRLALLAPADWASRVLHEDASRFSIGPLTEVIAQNHVWSDLVAHLPDGPQRDFVAYERALRGDLVSEPSSAGSLPVLDIPLAIQDWEPRYGLPTYSDTGVDHPCPTDRWSPIWRTLTLNHVPSISILDDEPTEYALRQLVEPWTSNSSGRARSVVVEGDEIAALNAIELEEVQRAGPVEITPLTPEQAVHWLTWCGASGGVHGRRRGMASGRFSTWWLLAALGGFVDDWDRLQQVGELSDALAELVQTMTWSRWRTIHRPAYELSLIGHDRDEGITIALSAFDDALTTQNQSQ